MGWTPFVMVTDLLEEAGEVAAIVKGLEGFKPPQKAQNKRYVGHRTFRPALHNLCFS